MGMSPGGLDGALAAIAGVRLGDPAGVEECLARLVRALGAQGAAVHLKDATSGDLHPGPAAGRPAGPGEALEVPLRVGGETVGCLLVTGLPDAGAHDARRAGIALGLAIRTSQLFEGLQARARDLDREVRQLMAMQEIARAVTRVESPEELALVVARQARRLLRGTAAAVVRPGPDGPVVLAQEGTPRAVAWTAALAAARSGRVQVLPGPEVAVPIPGDGTPSALVVDTDRGVLPDDDADRLETLAQQAGIALANLRLLDDVRREQERRSAVAAALVHAQEEERSRIAEDLHDGPVQELVGLGLILDALAEELRAAGAPGVEAAARASSAARGAVGALREAIFDLHPMSLQQLGFAAAVRVVLQRAEARGLATAMHGLDAADALGAHGRTVAFRIVQEAVANAVRHSGAATLTVSAGEDDGLWVEVTDDGRGFVLDEIPTRIDEGHLGLDAMRARARLAGADVDVRSEPGRGTAVRLRFPAA
ncbi:MAG: sensor histidine kinase [Thermoleophilia bacterium]|nr:sensor histidine kinase [Thermoleophilia bacterium]